MSFFRIFSLSQIFNLVTANDRYKNSLEESFSFFPRSTPRGFITNLVEKIEKLLNHKTDFKSCDDVE